MAQDRNKQWAILNSYKTPGWIKREKLLGLLRNC